MDSGVNTIFSVVAGCSIASAIALFFIKRALTDLDEVSKKINHIEINISRISAKLDQAENNNSLLHIHDKKIAILENEIYARRRKAPT